jgi:His/Glu/Gln/Arg/opine family amino acid ABC transporter permease subunit
MGFEFDWSVVSQYRSWIVAGAWVTFRMAVAGIGIALILGLLVALIRMSRFKVISSLGDAYIQFFRGMPLFVFLIWVYYGMAMLTGVNIPSVTTGLLCLSMLHAAYLAETYRAGIEAVTKGQREAALSVGLKPSQVMRYIVLPQAIRTVLPPIGNEFMLMLKSTTILGLVGVEELVKRTQLATTLSFRPFELYTVLALVFVGTVTVFSRIVRYLERRLSYAK